MRELPPDRGARRLNAGRGAMLARTWIVCARARSDAKHTERNETHCQATRAPRLPRQRQRKRAPLRRPLPANAWALLAFELRAHLAARVRGAMHVHVGV